MNSMIFSQANYIDIQRLAALRDSLGLKLMEQLKISQQLLLLQSQTIKTEQRSNIHRKNIKIQCTISQPEKKLRRCFKKKLLRKGCKQELKNDTKNIPKNYGKAILSYIQKNSHRIKELASNLNIPMSQFMAQVRRNKLKINSIANLRNLWSGADSKHPFKKIFRILSHQFMRKHCLMYIFRSRVKNYASHIKYRTKIIEGIQNPEKFTFIKEY